MLRYLIAFHYIFNRIIVFWTHSVTKVPACSEICISLRDKFFVNTAIGEVKRVNRENIAKN